MKESTKELLVKALQEGTVIDHIPANKLFQVISILKLEDCENLITFGTNLDSKVLGKKAIIKIAHRFFHKEDYNRIALVAPNARVNEIRDYNVVKKTSVQIPDEISSIVLCFNPICVTNKERIGSKFHVSDKKDLKLKCLYCEKITHENELVFT